MAVGQPLFDFNANAGHGPVAIAAAPVAELSNGLPVRQFVAAAGHNFAGTLHANYAGNGITVTLHTGAETATSGTMTFAVAFERGADGDAMATDAFAASKSVVVTAPGVAQTFEYASISFSNSEIDGLLVNERFRLRVTLTSATIAGNALLVSVAGVEG